MVRGRLIISSLLAGIVVPASSALAASPQRHTATSSGIGIQLVGARADSGNGPLANSYIVDRLAPGTSIRRRIEISNNTSTTAVFPSMPPLPASAAGRSGSRLATTETSSPAGRRSVKASCG